MKLKINYKCLFLGFIIVFFTKLHDRSLNILPPLLEISHENGNAHAIHCYQKLSNFF
jgi:hypothetical protein